MALVNWTKIEQEIDNAGYVAIKWFSMQKDELKSYPFLRWLNEAYHVDGVVGMVPDGFPIG